MALVVPAGCGARSPPSRPCYLISAQAVPLYVLGVSSGAAFALKLPMAMPAGMPVRGVVSGAAGAAAAPLLLLACVGAFHSSDSGG